MPQNAYLTLVQPTRSPIDGSIYMIFFILFWCFVFPLLTSCNFYVSCSRWIECRDILAEYTKICAHRLFRLFSFVRHKSKSLNLCIIFHFLKLRLIAIWFEQPHFHDLDDVFTNKIMMIIMMMIFSFLLYNQFSSPFHSRIRGLSSWNHQTADTPTSAMEESAIIL